MPLTGAYSADELAVRVAKAEIERDKLRTEVERLKAAMHKASELLENGFAEGAHDTIDRALGE
jgi:hypothetical protein